MKQVCGAKTGLFSAKKKAVLGAAGTLLAAISIAAGAIALPWDYEVPVLLANGEVTTRPWYVTVEDECVALVDSEDDA